MNSAILFGPSGECLLLYRNNLPLINMKKRKDELFFKGFICVCCVTSLRASGRVILFVWEC